jgi:hypothetical protein
MKSKLQRQIQYRLISLRQIGYKMESDYVAQVLAEFIRAVVDAKNSKKQEVKIGSKVAVENQEGVIEQIVITDKGTSYGVRCGSNLIEATPDKIVLLKEDIIENVQFYEWWNQYSAMIPEDQKNLIKKHAHAGWSAGKKTKKKKG